MSTTNSATGPQFGLSDEQTLLRSEVRRFAEERIKPGVRERDLNHEFPSEIIRELGGLGLLGMLVEEEFGGAGYDAVSYVIAIEEIARVCPSVAVAMSVTNSVCCWPIDQFGSVELREKFLPALAGGEMLGAFGLTEPGAGSDIGSIQTTAELADGSWILNGEKAWITNAGVAGVYVVVAKTDANAAKRGFSGFVVPAEAEGLSVGVSEEKLGLRASKTAPLVFDNCRIPASYILGEAGQGFKIALATLDHSRLGIAAQAVGIQQRALELAIEYANERVQFGVPISHHQAIRFSLAEIATEVAAARELTRYAAWRSHKKGGGRLASEAKLYASEAANRACYAALQIHGGTGFSEESEIARLYRDVRVTTIYEGTSEMQRVVIARKLLQT
jgi:alkylation response protein AidB-like acyl-CoA dehydrogenase